MEHTDNRTPRQRESAIRYHITRVEIDERALRQAGIDPNTTPADVADAILKKIVFILKKGIDGKQG